MSEHLSPLELEEAAAGLPTVTQAHLDGCAACKAKVQELQAASDGVRVSPQFKARLESVLQQAAEKPIARVDPETGELTISKKNPPNESAPARGLPTWQWLLPTLALAASLIAFVYWPQPAAPTDELRLKGATMLRVTSVDGREIEKARAGELVELAVGAAGFSQGLVLAADASGTVEVLWPPNATLSGRVPAGAGAHLQPAFEVTPGSLKLFAFFADGPFDVAGAKARVDAAVQAARAAGKSPLQAEVPSTAQGSVATVLLQVEP